MPRPVESPGGQRPAPSNLAGVDAVIAQVSWRPLKGSNSDSRSHRFTLASADCARFKVSLVRTALQGLALALVGLFVVGFTSLAISKHEWSMLFVPLFLLPVVGGGLYVMYAERAPIVFDLRSGFYIDSRDGARALREGRTDVGLVPLARVVAVQIVPRSCIQRSNKYTTRYWSYELNLVLDDGARVNVVDHANRRKVRQDAGKLAAFLGTAFLDDQAREA